MSYFGVGRLGTTRSIAYTGSAGSVAAVGAQVYKVRVVATTDAFVAFGAAPVASSTADAIIPALTPEYFTVTPGQKVSAVQNAAGGTLYVTEII